MNLEVGNYLIWLLWIIVPTTLAGAFLVACLRTLIPTEKPATTGDTTALATFEVLS